MLVLSRKKSEKILVGDGITVTVVSISSGRVKLGIEAPRSMRIHRPKAAARRQGDEVEPTQTPPPSDNSLTGPPPT